MRAVLAAVPVVGGVSAFVLISAGWGYVASWLNEIIKQDHWPKPFNTIVADAVVLITAVIVAWVHAGAWSWNAVWTATLFAFSGALLNAHGFLQPTGIGPALQTATSLPPRRPPPAP